MGGKPKVNWEGLESLLLAGWPFSSLASLSPFGWKSINQSIDQSLVGSKAMKGVKKMYIYELTPRMYLEEEARLPTERVWRGQSKKPRFV
jgi:hypothetical protein